MARRMLDRPSDGVRRLNLKYRVDDPRYLVIERFRQTFRHGQGTGLLLAALAVGAEVMLGRLAAAAESSAPATAGTEHPKPRTDEVDKVTPKTERAPVRFSDATRKQFEQWDGD
ncbi:MAG TPA: hypothetical protein VN259_07415 [Xanthomonadales bacterium]|nr:hypothetical protein [Xanthomonadales bacterium]